MTMINRFVLVIAFLMPLIFSARVTAEELQTGEVTESTELQGYAGSSSCRHCHARFYQLWSTSMHGLAMQPYTADFAKARLTAQQNDVAIGKLKYRADINAGVVVETSVKGSKKYRIEHVMGGKNVFYFLTPLPRGKLQTLPVAYDVNKQAWFDTALSGVRHFPGERGGQPLSWKNPAYTFNTACYSCHVSQLSTNYDQKKDVYHTTWTEPGINCETCHGPAGQHNRIAEAAPKGQPLPDLGLISVKTMSTAERIDLCSSCHAKASPLTVQYKPKERFFDHFDLASLEDPDFYPDGRDLGENYTFTSWLMSPCAKSGKLDCMHCHTSSGRYRFKDEAKANDACLPCHEARVKNAAAHTHHLEGSRGNQCISCHMPMTSFARMNRSDHSMLPPTPAVTIEYKSPNACNLCHKDKDAAWADSFVRQWHVQDYQAPVLARTALIDAARKRDWSKLPEILAYIRSKDRDEVFATSLIRLLRASPDNRITPVLLVAMKDPSPLVRSSAVEAIAVRPSREAVQALLDATGDDSRLVRTRAAAGLSGFPLDRLTSEVKFRVEKANKEHLAFIMARPDQWTSHYNMGNYQLSRGELKQAIASYQAALKLEPQAVLAMVNSSIAYAQTGDSDKAEKSLQEALKTAPDSAAANFNMGLLKAEKNAPNEAEKYLRRAIKADPQMAQAAYNLCIITAKDRLGEAVTWCRKAADLSPQDPRYAYTLAFYLNQNGQSDAAAKTLDGLIGKHPGYADAYLLLGGIYEKQGKKLEAEKVYGKALDTEGIPDSYKYRISAQLNSLKRQ